MTRLHYVSSCVLLFLFIFYNEFIWLRIDVSLVLHLVSFHGDHCIPGCLGRADFVCMAFNQCQECQSFVIVAVDSRTSFVATLSSCNSLSAIFVHAYSHLRTSMYNICTVIFLGPLSSHMFSQPFFAAAGIAGYKLNMRLGEASEGEICCHNNVRKRLKCAKWRRSQSNWWVSSPDIQYTAFRPHQLTGRCSGKFRCKGTQFGRSRGQVKTFAYPNQ